MTYKDNVKLSKRRETLPRRFRDIFPGLNTFCNEWNDYNDSFRDCNHDLRSLNDEMQMALDAGDNEKLSMLLGQAEVSCQSSGSPRRRRRVRKSARPGVHAPVL
jgi:hypothetical protein